MDISLRRLALVGFLLALTPLAVAEQAAPVAISAPVGGYLTLTLRLQLHQQLPTVGHPAIAAPATAFGEPPS
jgi:hypothetical protein